MKKQCHYFYLDNVGQLTPHSLQSSSLKGFFPQVECAVNTLVSKFLTIFQNNDIYKYFA